VTCPQPNPLTVVCGNPPACSGVGNGIEVTGNSSTGTCATGSYNSGTLKDPQGNYCCTADSTPCQNPTVGSGTETGGASPGSQTGTCPSGQVVVGHDQGGEYCCGTLGPCTANSLPGSCVKCQGNTSGICTPTEADFVQHDITAGLATVAGNDPSTGCYSCLLAGGCVDSSSATGNECEDNSGASAYVSGTTVAECEAVVQCILGSGTGAAQCASSSVGTCYCGAGVTNATCAGGSSTTPDVCSTTAGPIKGVCATQIAAGLGFPCGDGADIAPNFNTTNLAGGRANQLFTCANSNSCTQCL